MIQERLTLSRIQKDVKEAYSENGKNYFEIFNFQRDFFSEDFFKDFFYKYFFEFFFKDFFLKLSEFDFEIYFSQKGFFEIYPKGTSTDFRILTVKAEAERVGKFRWKIKDLEMKPRIKPNTDLIEYARQSIKIHEIDAVIESKRLIREYQEKIEQEESKIAAIRDKKE